MPDILSRILIKKLSLIQDFGGPQNEKDCLFWVIKNLEMQRIY